MALSDIAAGIVVHEEQRDRGVAAVDDTGGGLAALLAPYEDDLPCSAASAATVVRSHAAGRSVGESGRRAGVAPVTAAKALHLLGFEGVSPLAPEARRVVRDWLDAELPRTEARSLTGADEAEFALATFVETHEPLDGAAVVVESALAPGGDAAVAKRDALAGTMSDVTDLR